MKFSVTKSTTSSINSTPAKVIPPKSIVLEPLGKESVDEEISEDLTKSVNTDESLKDSSKVSIELTPIKITEEVQEEVELGNFSTDLIKFPADFYEIPTFNANVFEQNMLNLAEEINEEEPELKFFLKEIYQDLKKYPELAYLLEPKQIGLIVESFKIVRKVEISGTKPKKKNVLKSLDNMSTDDLLNLIV